MLILGLKGLKEKNVPGPLKTRMKMLLLVWH